MKVHEYQAKEIFARYGIPVPQGSVASTAHQARQATTNLGGQAVLKAQVHAGGRGKAGGVKVVRSPAEAERTARSLLGSNLVTHQTDARGVPVGSLLVEELADIRQELYLAITIDRNFRGPVVLASGCHARMDLGGEAVLRLGTRIRALAQHGTSERDAADAHAVKEPRGPVRASGASRCHRGGCG